MRIVADCLAEVVFSTIKTSKFLFDVPKIVSNWPFANGVRTPMYASFAQCSHKFSDISHKKSEEPSNGTENGSGNSGFLRSKVPRPLHRMFLTGIFNPTVLAELAEVLCALSEVGPEGNAEGKGDRVVDMVGTDEDGTQNMGTGLEASSSSSSRSIDVKGKYPFDISTLRNFDNAFLHPKSLVSGTISDKKKEDNSAEDLGPIATLIPAESARLPKIPMKFNSIIVDNLSSSLPYTVRAAAREPAESNSSGVGRLSLSGMNVLSSMYGTDDDYRDDTDSSLTNDPTWIATKRAEDRPYFIVRTASTQRMECFCHYLQTPLLIPRNRVQDPVGGSISGDTDNDSGSMLVDKREGEGIGAVATMDSYLPITEIRWPSAADSALFTAPLSAPSSLSSSSFASIGAIKKEDKVSVKNRRVSLEQPKNGSAVSRGYGDDGIIDADMLTGKKRKHPIPLSVSIPASVTLSEVNINAVASSTSSNNELDSYYDVVYGAKLPILCLIQAKHSKVIVREKMESENSGAVLNEMNKYEIYAPETLEDRQRKRMTM